MSAMLEVRGVARAFGGVKALNGVNLTVERGSITGLIGPNGSGKTTLFNVITGYVTPDAGTVSFEGTDITRAKPNQVFALGIGRTFQLTRIFSRLSVLENMLVATQRKESWLRGLTRGMSSSAELESAMEWLKFVGLDGKSHLEAGALSYGQRKLLELAYVLVANPDVIMLDNFPLPDMAEAVRRCHGRVRLEASGGVSLETVAAIAATGVDAISVGALTHSAPVLDIGLDAV